MGLSAHATFQFCGSKSSRQNHSVFLRAVRDARVGRRAGEQPSFSSSSADSFRPSGTDSENDVQRRGNISIKMTGSPVLSCSRCHAGFATAGRLCRRFPVSVSSGGISPSRCANAWTRFTTSCRNCWALSVACASGGPSISLIVSVSVDASVAMARFIVTGRSMRIAPGIGEFSG